MLQSMGQPVSDTTERLNSKLRLRVPQYLILHSLVLPEPRERGHPTRDLPRAPRADCSLRASPETGPAEPERISSPGPLRREAFLLPSERILGPRPQ